MATGTVLAVAAILGAAGTVANAVITSDRTRKANHLRQQANAQTAKANAEARKQRDIVNLRQRRAAARNAITARSRVIAAGAAQDGGAVTSAQAGQAGAAITTGASNISFLDSVAASQNRQATYTASANQIFGQINALNARPNYGAIVQDAAGATQNVATAWAGK